MEFVNLDAFTSQVKPLRWFSCREKDRLYAIKLEQRVADQPLRWFSCRILCPIRSLHRLVARQQENQRRGLPATGRGGRGYCVPCRRRSNLCAGSLATLLTPRLFRIRRQSQIKPLRWFSCHLPRSGRWGDLHLVADQTSALVLLPRRRATRSAEFSVADRRRTSALVSHLTGDQPCRRSNPCAGFLLTSEVGDVRPARRPGRR